ncbi:LOW QUALITY PROTEIN: OX-2 membrane glycoprotein [Pantherophis guttatus]|uniref:LOW QUALITY PROTEIN: OX-2 membrane glycoprotein n=1 Tax=Pantherophis guttatus TaxID=94885 RepID=A0A6P9BIN2_PANGU|nr:LOW QUALITY PROTEIN: OX-2 membrane glycoprotein [Pantherophis guttatus]
MRMKGIYTTWTLQDLALCIIAVVFCSTQGSVMTSNQDVELGGNVTLRCLFQQPHIYQVTWRKKKNGNDENIATYKKDTGSTVLKYKDRINFIIGSPQDTAINLLNVSTEDNGCYECAFLLFPIGPVIGQPCLSVYDDLKTSIDYNVSDNHLHAKCLATGFPRPNISWFPSGGEKKEKDITNPNGTLSVISNILISKSNVEQGLTCHISHRGKMISLEVLGKEIDHTKISFPVVPVVLALILVILVIVVSVCCWRRQRKKHRGF